jgi:hemolysin activation/secretion protein
MRLPSLLLLAALLAGLAPSLALAQDYSRIAPQVPAAPAGPSLTPPAAPVAAPASTRVILPVLKGLVFLADPHDVVAAGRASPGIHATGLPLLAEPGFSAEVAPFLGKPASLADLETIGRLANAWYRSHDRPFVSVDLPPQNISAGTVQLVVTEYRLGQVQVSGNRWFSSEDLRRESGFVPGQSLVLPDVQGGLDRLNANPFRTVNMTFQPGVAPGTTDVTLRTQDRLPLHLYAGYDNQGVPSLGREEWNVGGSWGNLFGLGQILSYQFTRSFSGRYNAHSLSWTIPLPWQDQLLVFGSYAEEQPNIGTDFGQTGHSGQASLRYVHPLPRRDWGGHTLTQDVQLGYDFKTTDSNLEFDGLSVFATEAETDQFPMIYDASLADGWGETSLENQLVISPGGLTGANTNAASEALVPGSAADYLYDRIALTRVTLLPRGFSWIAQLTGQLADRNLLDSEQLGAGGEGSVRGYDTDTALGSEGVLVSNEVRTPAVSLADRDSEQVGVFWDWGHVSQVRTIPDLPMSATLSSAGVDLHAALGRYLDAKFDLGWRLRNAPGDPDHGAFADIAVVAGF